MLNANFNVQSLHELSEEIDYMITRVKYYKETIGIDQLQSLLLSIKDMSENYMSEEEVHDNYLSQDYVDENYVPIEEIEEKVDEKLKERINEIEKDRLYEEYEKGYNMGLNRLRDHGSHFTPQERRERFKLICNY